MLDVFKIADAVISKVVTCYPDDVDLVAYYGSYAQGTAKPDSDLDIFYVPSEGRNPPVAQTALVEGILLDFWPIPWDMLESFATGRIRGWSMAPALVYHSKIIYKRSMEAERRLNALKKTITDLEKPEARPQMVKRALDMFQAVLAHLGNLYLALDEGRFSNVRNAGFLVLVSAFECLALANQAFFDWGLRSIIAQSYKLQSKPRDFETLATIIGTSSDPREIAEAAQKMALGTREVLRHFQISLSAHREISDQFKGTYPEIKDGLRKVVSECEKEQRFDAAIFAWRQQVDLSQMLSLLDNEVGGRPDFNLYGEFSVAYEKLGFEDFLSHPSDDLAGLAEKARRLDQSLRLWLKGRNVDLQEFDSIEEFRKSLSA